jgi:bacterioferritin
VTPRPVKTSEKAEETLWFDLENEKEMIRLYRRPVVESPSRSAYDLRARNSCS